MRDDAAGRKLGKLLGFPVIDFPLRWIFLSLDCHHDTSCNFHLILPYLKLRFHLKQNINVIDQNERISISKLEAYKIQEVLHRVGAFTEEINDLIKVLQ